MARCARQGGYKNMSSDFTYGFFFSPRRSANFNGRTGDCRISDMDRHTVSSGGRDGSFAVSKARTPVTFEFGGGFEMARARSAFDLTKRRNGVRGLWGYGSGTC